MILVTGHKGLIGDRILKELGGIGVDRGDKIPDNNYEMIIHCGSNTFVRDCLSNPDLAKENMDRAYEIMELARKNKCPIIMFSSSRTEHEFKNPYVLSKKFLEDIVLTYHENYSVDYLIIRPETIWGYCKNNDRVVNKWIENALTNKDIEIYGDEDKELSPLYIDEFIKIFREIYKTKNKSLSISGEIRKAKDITQEIINFFGSNSKVVFKPAEEFQPQRCFKADIVGNVNFPQELNKYYELWRMVNRKNTLR